ncbi:M24 family metallopeptidase [Inhella proteolytica]|uniref:Aminopeptidase P family protein n=1 Tax=Inhella proteolytica TaxID=2795029 RepID=A0A931J6B9_9BURK|nr:Xaa-Pro peptidase family protein [Inhella proteolytica]MBH9579040.1 aminopeptidase P family protein [Inhella proteolytica]
MTIGVGGLSPEAALQTLQPMMAGVQDIQPAEYQARIEKVQGLLRAQGLAGLLLVAGTNLRYFTGLRWRASERFVGALLPAEGPLQYIAPAFERGTVEELLMLPGPLHTWEEHESPYALIRRLVPGPVLLALDEAAPFFVVDGLQHAGLVLRNAHDLTAECRMHKSPAELALMQRAFDMTLAVHRATASMLHAGIRSDEVEAFIDQAHRRAGAAGNSFVIVLFGVASSFPHGVKEPQVLKDGDMVLIDTGCYVHGYSSDITRSYVFGTPDAEARRLWNLEKAAQAAAFAAARLGQPCEVADAAARQVLEAGGLGPDYALPGLPHRTGHGIGLDIHERPYLVRGERTPLAPGMCFSNEPMIVVPGRYGIRLEDHFYMTEAGPRWFTPPAHAVDDPFGLQA